MRSPQLEEGERHVVVMRPHYWRIVRAGLPLPLLLFSPLLYTAVDLAAPALRLAVLLPFFLWLLGIVLLAYAVKWLLWDVLPWLRQSYVVTNRRVIVQAGVLSVYRQECSLLKVEETDYVSRGPMARLLDIGDVNVHTAGRRGEVALRGVARPRRIQELISAETRASRYEATRRRLAEEPREVMRQLVTAIEGTPDANVAVTEPVRPISNRAARMQQRLNLLSEEAVLMVTRQHPMVLIVGLLGPLLGVFFVVAVVAVVGLGVLPLAEFAVVCILAPWAVWRVLDYLAHEYVVTTDRLMELRSVPLLFQTRDIVQLESVQDIALDIPTFFGRLADVGDVVVEVAGPDERVVIKTVAHPADLQNLLFESIDARRRARHARQDQQLVSTLSHWFAQYHKLQGGQDRHGAHAWGTRAGARRTSGETDDDEGPAEGLRPWTPRRVAKSPSSPRPTRGPRRRSV